MGRASWDSFLLRCSCQRSSFSVSCLPPEGLSESSSLSSRNHRLNNFERFEFSAQGPVRFLSSASPQGSRHRPNENPRDISNRLGTNRRERGSDVPQGPL